MVAGLGASAVAFSDEALPLLPIGATTRSAEATSFAGDVPYAAGVSAYPPEAPPVAAAQVAPEPSRSAARPTAPSAGTAAPADTVAGAGAQPAAPPVPARSGKGRRVVFSMSEQRVWLVSGSERVARTYAVSGSKHDNLDPGTYEVFSRSRHATSYDFGSTMEYFVRFTRGENAPIGFHTIPVDEDGKPLQTRAELGTALSSGCVRQWRKDAIALWEFAPIGTTVVVVA